MSERETHISPAGASSRKMLQTMVGIGVMCALLIVLAYEGTLPRVERLKAEALEKAIFRVLPDASEKATFRFSEADGFTSSGDGEASGQTVYAGYRENGELAGLVIEASGMGYADIIRILYGYDPERQAVVGFHVLESKETPGLGDKIEKDKDFLANFTALDVSLNNDRSALEHEVVPVKTGEKTNAWEVDGITGATISSRAIGNIIGESVGYWVPLIYAHREDFTTDGQGNIPQQ